jgi:hypothetical protein
MQERSRRSSSLVLGGLFLGLAAVGCSSSTGTAPVDGGGDAHGDTGKPGTGHDGATHDGPTKHDAATDAGSVSDAPVALDGWTVPSGCNPLAVVTTECMLPYPSDFLTVADSTTKTGLRMALPPGSLAVPDASIPIDMTPFNLRDGAPTSAPILVHFGVGVGASFLANDTQTASTLLASSPIALLDESTGERVPLLTEMDANGTDPTRQPLIIRPLRPLDFGTQYVVVITSAVTDTNGEPLPASTGFLALRDKVTTGNAAIEGARAHFESLFTFLAAHGYARGSLQLAWDYTTASSDMVIGPIAAMRQRVFSATTSAAPAIPDAGLDAALDAAGDAAADALVDGGGGDATDTITYSITSVTPSPYQVGANVIEGQFTPPNYLQPDNTLLYARNGIPALQTGLPAPSYPFTMIVPPLGQTQSLSLVLFGHGLFGDGRDYLTDSYGDILQPLAQQLGAVIVATDWIGLSSGDLDLIINDVVTNLNHVGIVTDRLLQALVNNLSLIELSLGALQKDPQVELSTSQPLIDPSRVYYYGVSLGGIEGSSLISTSRNVTRATVAVPGASWSNLLARSSDYAPIGDAVASSYPDELLQQEFITLLQSRFDPADPINLATLFERNPLPNSPSPRTVVMQESIDDCQVPNLTTELLARAYGIAEVTPDIVPIFGLTTTATPTTTSALSQFELLADVAKYVPPSTNVIPTMDNGAHFDLAFQPAALAEVVNLLTTGTILQACPDAGACFIDKPDGGT